MGDVVGEVVGEVGEVVGGCAARQEAGGGPGPVPGGQAPMINRLTIRLEPY